MHQSCFAVGDGLHRPLKVRFKQRNYATHTEKTLQALKCIVTKVSLN